jgi:hypothetical protein
VDIAASNPGVRDGTKLERLSCWEALLVSRNSSDLSGIRGNPCSEKIVASLVPKEN